MRHGGRVRATPDDPRARRPQRCFSRRSGRDGDLDIIASFRLDDRIDWFENLDGVGAFGPPRNISTATDYPESVYAADLDVLSASRVDDKIAWYENLDGAGSFGAEQLISSAAYGAMAIHGADVDGDGDVDVLSASYDDNKVSLHENLGSGSFGPRQVLSFSYNGAVDACELAAGSSFDCDRNGVPDECDAVCVTCDADGDNCLDEVDCNPDDATVWSEPLAIDSLGLSHTASTTTLSWQPPAAAGADVARYDTLRSTESSDFGSGVTCLESDQTDTTSLDSLQPAAGELFSYLIRVENDCPGGVGSMGSDASGVPRSGAACP